MDTADKNPVSCFDFLFFLYFSSYLALCCSAANRITPGQYIKDGEFLVSDGQNFELGFFSPNDSTLRYVGIWYHNVPETPIIWVANREKPISDKAGVLTIGSDGNLEIFDGKNNSIWSSNALVVSENTTAILDKNGNLILLSSSEIDDTEKAYWQSFNNPTDTFLPSMRVNVNAEIGENHAFTSWKSANDPSLGNYSMGVDPKGSPQIVIWKGSERKWRSGHWNSQIFTGIPNMSANLLYGFRFSEQNKDGNKYFTYVPLDSSDKMRFLISWEGYEEQLRWNDNEMKWDMIQSQPSKTNECELYNKCGNFGVCSSWESPICSCMQGFQPRDWNQWNKGDWSGGCSRKTSLQCQKNNTDTKEVDGEDGFVGVKGAKLPDFADLISGDMEACKDKCSGNCSCTSYSYVNGIGCMIWKGELIDIQHFKKGGNMLFIRLAHADLGGESKLSTAVIIIISVMGSAFLGLLIWLACRFKSKLKVLPATSISAWKSNKARSFDPSKSQEMPLDISGSVDPGMEGNQVNGSELPIFNFNCIAIATNNFSEENKLGQGGFGPVYMGSLPGGQEIAVKRLSRKSGQGVEEFKNEISLMAKLHHRNLVRLLGCSIQGEDKMLIYEYMPNKSLDFFLFDSKKQTLLDWRKRFTIIEGIARGLLYLHRDSRLRIIHRDLKASNVLLDEDMNPKISDFGMARIFGGNQDEANTNRVVGTYGYMSPEYAMEGLFSVKSDVYSFGVLLLEIVSGRKNTSFRSTEYTSLLVFAWHLWNEGKAVELIDSSISDECHKNEVLRCIQIGMLCVQDSAVNRPTMSSVVLMLESESVSLPLPRKPTLTSTRHNLDGDFFSEGRDSISINEITMTVLDGR